MKIIAHAGLALAVASSALLTACYYAPYPYAAYGGAMQRSYEFDRHPGVVMEVWSQQDYYGMATVSTRLVNHSNVDKCAWTDNAPGRLLRVGEVWQISNVQSPGNVGVANVIPTDPNCVNAGRVG